MKPSPRRSMSRLPAIYFGLLAGLVLTVALFAALSPWPFAEQARPLAQVVTAIVLCVFCTGYLLRADWPRVAFSQADTHQRESGTRPCVLDTSAIIDGRIADVVEARFLDNPLVVPTFVIQELQGIADSSDRLRRARGRRGLDILNRLRSNPAVSLEVFDRELPELNGQAVDQKLIALARFLKGKVVTGDYNLNKVAGVHGIEVLNVNDLATALRPTYLPGEQLEVLVVKPGEGAGQGVGYLDDGTMVIVESGRQKLNETVSVTVTSVLQTSAGRMIFSK